MVAMPQKPDAEQMTEAEYLEHEEKSDIKHEFTNGKVYAMAGASWNHNVICQNTGTTLANQLSDKACTVVASDLRLHVDLNISYRYPDVMVICGEPEFVDNRVDTINNPTVIIEILSPSTSLTDLNEKLAEYTQVDTVQEYIIIAQHEAKLERYLRHKSGEWLYKRVTGLESSLELPSIGCQLELSQIYSKVSFKINDS